MFNSSKLSSLGILYFNCLLTDAGLTRSRAPTNPHFVRSFGHLGWKAKGRGGLDNFVLGWNIVNEFTWTRELNTQVCNEILNKPTFWKKEISVKHHLPGWGKPFLASCSSSLSTGKEKRNAPCSQLPSHDRIRGTKQNLSFFVCEHQCLHYACAHCKPGFMKVVKDIINENWLHTPWILLCEHFHH